MSRCKHSQFSRRCRSCKGLQRKWYQRLKLEGFIDIEYGLDQPRFIRKEADPTKEGTHEAQEFYDKVWSIYHSWTNSNRSRRDCRLAELLAQQHEDTGTVRGISKVLRSENLPPWSTSCVQATIKEIKSLVLVQDTETNSKDSIVYLTPRHKAA